MGVVWEPYIRVELLEVPRSHLRLAMPWAV